MIRVGTRGSALALAQTRFVVDLLTTRHRELEVETVVIRTRGDRDQTSSPRRIGSVGIFTKELEHALLEREIDLAVHSLKDLPTETVPGLQIAAVPEREDPRDVLVCAVARCLEELPPGCHVGTGSPRRRGQLLAAFPHLVPLEMRGNIDTRMARVARGELSAILLAAAGLKRLGRLGEAVQVLPLSVMLPAPGQGALAVETRAGDRDLLRIAASLHHAPTALAVSCEREVLRLLRGGCRIPLGVHAQCSEEIVEVEGVLASADGRLAVREKRAGPQAEWRRVAAELTSALSLGDGAEILDRARRAESPVDDEGS